MPAERTVVISQSSESDDSLVGAVAKRLPRMRSSSARATAPSGVLHRLFSDPRDLERSWNKRILLERRAEDFTDLFSMADLRAMLRYGGLRLPEVRMVRERRSVHPDEFSADQMLGNHAAIGVVDCDRVRDQIDLGATLVLQGMRRYCKSLDLFAAGLEVDLGLPVDVSSFFTPASGSGSPAHHDLHDIFVLQVAGRRVWHTGPVPAERPIRHISPSEFGAHDVAATMTLAPGDVLYLPAGTLHIASPSGESALHLTLSLRHAPTVAELASAFVGGLIELSGTGRGLPTPLCLQAEDDSVFRDTLDFLKDALSVVSEDEVDRVCRRVLATFVGLRSGGSG